MKTRSRFSSAAQVIAAFALLILALAALPALANPPVIISDDITNQIPGGGLAPAPPGPGAADGGMAPPPPASAAPDGGAPDGGDSDSGDSDSGDSDSGDSDGD